MSGDLLLGAVQSESPRGALRSLAVPPKINRVVLMRCLQGDGREPSFL